MEKVANLEIWKADVSGDGGNGDGETLVDAAQPAAAGAGCVARAWHGINIWCGCAWELREMIPGFCSLMGSVKFCGPTAVTAVRVRGCGSGRVRWLGRAAVLALVSPG